MAARVAGRSAPAYRGLRAAARDAFVLDKSDPRSAYAAAEISRQLGDKARADTLYKELLARPKAPQRLKVWSREGLGRQ